MLGLIDGASRRYVERIDLGIEEEAKQAKRLADGEKSYNNIVRQDSMYNAIPKVQLLTPGFAKNNTPLDDREYATVLQTQDFYRGEPSFYVNKNNEAIQRAGKLLQYDIWSLNPNDYIDNDVKENLAQYDAAVIQTLADMYQGGQIKNELTGVTVQLRDITSQIPGYESFSIEKKRNVNDKASQALAADPRAARILGLIPDLQYFSKRKGDTVTYVPKIVETPHGETKKLDDPEIQANYQPLLKVSEQTRFLEPTEQNAQQTYQQLTTLANRSPGFTVQQGIDAVVKLNGHFNAGNIQTAYTGKLSAAPFQVEAIREDLDPVYNQIGFGNTVFLMSAAMPVDSIYRDKTSSPDLYDAIGAAGEFYKKEVMGISSPDDQAAFNTRLNGLTALLTNVKELKTAIELGGQLEGTPGAQLTKFKAGIQNAMNQLVGQYKDGAGVEENKANLDKFLAGLSEDDFVNGVLNQAALDKTISFLTNQLAYNVARSLESATGNARLSNIDVENAKRALGLTGLLASPKAAVAVLDLLGARTQREIEYMNAINSGDIKTMQNADILQQMVGTDSMLRVAGLSNLNAFGSLSKFRESLESELNKLEGFEDIDIKAMDTQVL